MIECMLKFVGGFLVVGAVIVGVCFITVWIEENAPTPVFVAFCIVLALAFIFGLGYLYALDTCG